MDKLRTLIAAAQAHGQNSEPDHEVGDIREMLEACWTRLTEAQKEEVYSQFRELIRSELGSDKV